MHTAQHIYDSPLKPGGLEKPMYKISDAVRSAHGQDGAVLFDLRTGRMLRLNSVGSMIFQRLEEGRAQSQIVEEISRDFNVCPTTVQKDVIEFLRSLEQLKLIHCDSGQGTLKEAQE